MVPLKIEIPKTFSCSECGKALTPANLVMDRYSCVSYCSIECQDRGEEKNQGADYDRLETLNQED
jgi:hypothetical protein